MPSGFKLPRDVEQALARGWTVVTANQRAARTLRRTFDRAQQASGAKAWSPAAVFAWDTWLGMLWRRLVLEGKATSLLLNPAQEHVLWCEVLREDAELAAAGSLRPVESLAELAADAWALVRGYRAHGRLAQRADTADTRAFARWAGEFDRRLDRRQYLTGAQLAGTLERAFAAGELRLESANAMGRGGLLVVGFDRMMPVQTALLDAVAAAGAGVELAPVGREMAEPGEGAAGRLVLARSEHEELHACARWVRDFVAERPGAQVAVIVPQPDAERTRIERAFRHVLAPELEDIADTAGRTPYEFSLGVPLAGTAIGAAALDILRWVAEPLPLERVTALLLSRHFARGEEYVARAAFDAGVLRRRSLLRPELSVAGLLGMFRPETGTELPVLLGHLRQLRAAQQRHGLADGAAAARSYGQWVELFGEVLSAAGWPGDGLNTLEFQARRRWDAALDELASLDFEGRAVGFAEALGALRRLAGRTLFAPESQDAPVQVLGPMEAAGSRFDAVWFLRAGDLSWPVPPATNPLLPWAMQHDLQMPGGDLAYEAELGRRVAGRMATSAPVVLFSYAEQMEDETQRASPALGGLGLEAMRAEEVSPAPPAEAPLVLEVLADEEPVAAPPDGVLRGGAALLKAQAACGFRAFAERRLFSGGLEEGELGLDARERGVLVHAVLEAFWREVETQEALRLLSMDERDAMLGVAINEALAGHVRRAEPGWAAAYLETERMRLLRVLRPWLELELRRPPFAVRVVENRQADVAIGPLRLELRVDRVDTHLRDGEPAGEVLLDYKTGSAHPSSWLGERPDEPQLPLYAVVAAERPPVAVAFATIRAGEGMKLIGYEAEKGLLPSAARLKAPSLEAQVEEWRGVLTALAEQFYEGVARVAPKQYPMTCRTCEQRLLCRLDPAKLEPEAIEDLGEPVTSDPEAEVG